MVCFILDPWPVVCMGAAAARLHPRSCRRGLSLSEYGDASPCSPSSGPLQQPADSLLAPRPRCVSSQPEQPHPKVEPPPHPHTAVLCCFLSFCNVFLHHPTCLFERVSPSHSLCSLRRPFSLSTRCHSTLTIAPTACLDFCLRTE
jgi:hypothetical protein